MPDNSNQDRRVLVIDDTESIHGDFRAILADSRATNTALDEAEAAIFGETGNVATQTPKTCYQLDSAFQGQEGLEMVRQALERDQPYQLAFVDMRMPPGWDGLRTIEEIWKVDPHLQIVICTAHSDYSWDEIIQRLGHSDCLLILKKPFDNVEVEQLAGALTEKWLLARRAEARMTELEQMVAARTQELKGANDLLKREIGERSQAEERLRISEANLARAQEVAHIGSWYLDIRGHGLAWSDETYRIFGVPKGKPLSNADFHRALHPDDEALIRASWSAALKGAPYDVEHRIVVGEDVRWIRLKAEIDFDESGRAVRAIGTTQDVTKRKQTEQALRENEQKFRSFVENASDIIFCLSTEGVFTYVSPNWESMLGHDVSEVVGQPMAQFLPEGGSELCHQVLVQVVATGRKEEGIECQLRHKDGSWRWHTVSVSPLKTSDGCVTAVVGIAHDITRRKSGQEELQRAKQELQQILSASTPLCVISKDYEVLMLNDTFCSLFAINVDALAGKKCYDVMCTSKCHSPECPVRNISADGERYRYEVSIEDGAAGEITCMATATPYFNPDYSDITGVVISFMDITERKKVEKAIAEANTKLEQANRELKDMQSQVIQNEKLASIGQLAAGVAHEMNTPVGFVASNFQTLQSYMSKFLKLFAMYEDLAKAVEAGDKDSRLECIEEINTLRKRMKIDFIIGDLEELFSESREGLGRVTDIIQNLRDFSRVDQSEDCAEYDLNEGLKTTLTVARNELKYDVDMELEFCDVPLVACHSGQINQVFLNILVNAAQAIRGQGRGEKGNIRIRTYPTETHVVCEIADDGPGIPPEVLSKVFDPFFTTKPPGKGTGLGLSVSHDIVVNKHKGELSVDSHVGQGTTFTVKLPINLAIPGEEKEGCNETEESALC